MVPSELPYTSEEEALADQFARNSGLLSECPRHPGQFFRTYSRAQTIERIDRSIESTHDRLLALLHRNDLQKKALVVIVLRNYPETCRNCGAH